MSGCYLRVNHLINKVNESTRPVHLDTGLRLHQFEWSNLIETEQQSRVMHVNLTQTRFCFFVQFKLITATTILLPAHMY